MPDHVVERFDRQDAITAAAIIDLWVREGVAEADRRVSDVHLVARAGTELVGVSTARLARQAQLRLDMWHYRVFTAASHRFSTVGIELAVRGRSDLSARWVEGTDTRAPGMVYEIENEGLKRRFPEAHWLPTDVIFIGVNPHGDHVRVHWFPGALAPPPRGTE